MTSHALSFVTACWLIHPITCMTASVPERMDTQAVEAAKHHLEEDMATIESMDLERGVTAMEYGNYWSTSDAAAPGCFSAIVAQAQLSKVTHKWDFLSADAWGTSNADRALIIDRPKAPACDDRPKAKYVDGTTFNMNSYQDSKKMPGNKALVTYLLFCTKTKEKYREMITTFQGSPNYSGSSYTLLDGSSGATLGSTSPKYWDGCTGGKLHLDLISGKGLLDAGYSECKDNNAAVCEGIAGYCIRACVSSDGSNAECDKDPSTLWQETRDPKPRTKDITKVPAQNKCMDPKTNEECFYQWTGLKSGNSNLVCVDKEDSMGSTGIKDYTTAVTRGGKLCTQEQTPNENQKLTNENAGLCP